MIRVCLVEDQNIVREGLRALLALNPDIQVVGEASDGEEALEVIEREKPDVVLLDLRMPRLDGLGVLKQIKTPALILTTFDDDAMLFEAVRAGAKGWLLKDVSLDRLTTAIRTVAAGGTCIEPVITERIVRALDSSRSRHSNRPSCRSRSPIAKKPSSVSSPAATATARSPNC